MIPFEECWNLGQKYNLPVSVVEEEIEALLSCMLTEHCGFEVEAVISPEGLKIYGYVERGGELKVKSLDLKQYSLRRFPESLSVALAQRSVLSRYEALKYVSQSVLEGQVVQEQENGDLVVEIQDPGLFGLCARRQQPPSERGHYRRGEQKAFFVLAMLPVLADDVPRLEIRLSRTTKKLVEGLFRRQLGQSHSKAEIKCTRRIAGAFSEVQTTEKLPRALIQSVSKEVKERIRVFW